MKQNIRKPFYNNIFFFNPLPMVDLTNKRENASFRLKWVILQDYCGFCIHCFYNRIIICVYVYKTDRFFWSPSYISTQKIPVLKPLVSDHIITMAKSRGVRREDQAELYCFVRYSTVVQKTSTKPPNNMAVRNSCAQTTVAISPSPHEAKGLMF